MFLFDLFKSESKEPLSKEDEILLNVKAYITDAVQRCRSLNAIEKELGLLLKHISESNRFNQRKTNERRNGSR
jgi:hypothetical protein